jgi:branched-chain amino acid transport system permease protein
MAALFAIVLGLCILHLCGHYFAIGSLVIPDVLREVTNTWVSVTGGGIGLNLPLIGGSADCRAESGSAQGCSFRYRRDRWLD